MIPVQVWIEPAVQSYLKVWGNYLFLHENAEGYASTDFGGRESCDEVASRVAQETVYFLVE